MDIIITLPNTHQSSIRTFQVLSLIVTDRNCDYMRVFPVNSRIPELWLTDGLVNVSCINKGLKEIGENAMKLRRAPAEDVPSVLRLDMSGNQFETVDLMHVARLTGLRELLFRDNNVTSIAPVSRGNFSYVIGTLDLTANSVKTLDLNALAGVVGVVLVNENPTRHLTPVNASDSSVVELQFVDTAFEFVDLAWFTGLTALRNLLLHRTAKSQYNGIVAINSSLPLNIPSLEFLNVSGNRLISFDAIVSPLKGLRTLDLGRNALTSLNAEEFADFLSGDRGAGNKLLVNNNELSCENTWWCWMNHLRITAEVTFDLAVCNASNLSCLVYGCDAGIDEYVMDVCVG